MYVEKGCSDLGKLLSLLPWPSAMATNPTSGAAHPARGSLQHPSAQELWGQSAIRGFLTCFPLSAFLSRKCCILVNRDCSSPPLVALLTFLTIKKCLYPNVLSLSVMPADSRGRYFFATCGLCVGLRGSELVSFMSSVLQMCEEHGFREGRRLSLQWEVTLALCSATQESPTIHPCCSAGLNL